MAPRWRHGCPVGHYPEKGANTITDLLVVQIARESMWTVLLLSLPTLAVSLVIGLVVSILQATTQVQEQSLTFIPKIIAVFITLVITAPWLIKILLGFTTKLYARLPSVTQ